VRYCRRILPEARAEDAVQQAFVNAFAALRRDDDRRIDLRPWLYRIAHNSAVNALRERGLRHAELDEAIDGVERPDQALERRQGLRDVITAVKALPERQRDAMILRELEGRSYEEIAVELGVTGGRGSPAAQSGPVNPARRRHRGHPGAANGSPLERGGRADGGPRR
jgi:RNA polymerase sigma factor (sigma-70 family)